MHLHPPTKASWEGTILTQYSDGEVADFRQHDESWGSIAVLSRCETYRYLLGRRWESKPLLGFVMLNPSTADAHKEDPTIRKCVGFAKRNGYGGIIVANLFAFRATDPSALATAQDPVGVDNDQYIHDVTETFDTVIAWGLSGGRLTKRRAEHVLASWRGKPPMCLRKNKQGSPAHPLYLPSASVLLPYL